MSTRSTASYFWKIPLCGLIYGVTTMLSAAMLTPFEPEPPPWIVDVNPYWLQGRQLLAGLLVAVGLALLATRIRGSLLSRWFALFAFVFVVHSVTSAIEAHFFTTLEGMLSYMLPVALLPSGLCALALALLLVSPPGDGPFIAHVRHYFSTRSIVDWGWRFPTAVLAFPIIYFVFGMIISPFVLDYYEAQEYLRIPGIGLLLLIQHLRSALLLLVILPILIMWSGSRLRLWLSMGTALFLLGGLTGLIQGGDLFPMQIRVIHGIEILADALVHAAALVLLLGRKR